nr:flexible cuticle protein 12-like [Penaeus vannamei]
MQRLLVLACLVAVVVADSYKTPIPILKDDRTQNAYGEYTFDFETGNGIARNEAGKQADGQESSGGWSYTAPEGVPIKLSFTSGVGGYQPVGDHLPVAPTPVLFPTNVRTTKPLSFLITSVISEIGTTISLRDICVKSLVSIVSAIYGTKSVHIQSSTIKP